MLDDAANARAAAVYQEESGKWDGLIEAVADDMSLSREQRAALIGDLRQKQQAAASAAQSRVIEEEMQKLKAFRRFRQQQIKPIKPSDI